MLLLEIEVEKMIYLKTIYQFTFYYAWCKIQLIDEASQSGLAKIIFLMGKTYNVFQAAKKAV